jgi:hypothetical protein
VHGPEILPALVIPWAYAGPGAGMELIPYFLGLLAWMGTALGAVLLWPLYAVLRRFRRGKGADPAETGGESVAAALPESPGAAKADKP